MNFIQEIYEMQRSMYDLYVSQRFFPVEGKELKPKAEQEIYEMREKALKTRLINATTYHGNTIAWWKARRAEHRALWNWLSLEGERHEGQWPGWVANGGLIEKCMANSLACQISGPLQVAPRTGAPGCENCPINWGPVKSEGVTSFIWCYKEHHPYRRWKNLESLGNRKTVDSIIAYFQGNRKVLARIIRDTKWHFEGGI